MIVTPNPETAKRCMQRIARIERRLRQISKKGMTEKQAGEVSALKWAIPVLEEYVRYKYGKMPTKRMELWKHEYAQIKENLILDYGLNCYICKKQFSAKQLTIDHVIPVAKGGQDIYDNYRLACDPCNSIKGSELLEEME